MLVRSIKHYLFDHWNGKQRLGWSFWVNLVLLRLLLIAAQDWLNPFMGSPAYSEQLFVLIAILIAHAAIFIWQAVGVIRAGENYIKNNGFMAPVWGAQIAMVITFFLVLANALDLWQSFLHKPVESIKTEQNYQFTPSRDGLSLSLTGVLELGITGQFQKQIQNHPNIRQVILDSNGGNIFEARGLSKTIQQHGLNTLVISECSSACTTVFIGGVKRQLTQDARLGFHQYRIDANYAVLNASPLREQEKDRQLFLQAGVKTWFLDTMFDSQASEMWYPEHHQLIEAFVVTQIITAPNKN